MDSNKNRASADQNKKAPMTDEERFELCQQLDKELEDVMDKLPRRQPTDIKNTDWQEELENHPFFMKKVPEPGEKLHPLYEGLQKLKYDPDENTPKELAVSYKEDGNFNFKHKNYRLAILSYTEGIKAKCSDPDIQATLYNNRAAANYFLRNYRSCLRDCEMALKFKPGYNKVLLRAANCCFNVESYQKCIKYCDLILENDSCNKDIAKLRQKGVNAEKLRQRDLRKHEMLWKKKNDAEALVLNIIASRNFHFDFENDKLTSKKLLPSVPQLADYSVHLSDDGNTLVWPVTIVYPEYKVMDFVQEFNESHTIYDHLCVLFETKADWDVEDKYRPDQLNVFFENRQQKLFKVNINDDLKTVLQHKEFTIKCGTPSFIVLVRSSSAEKSFLEKYNFI